MGLDFISYRIDVCYMEHGQPPMPELTVTRLHSVQGTNNDNKRPPFRSGLKSK